METRRYHHNFEVKLSLQRRTCCLTNWNALHVYPKCEIHDNFACIEIHNWTSIAGAELVESRHHIARTPSIVKSGQAARQCIPNDSFREVAAIHRCSRR